MSTPGTRRGVAGGPRRPPGPRGGAGRRGPGAPRQPQRASAPAIAARELGAASELAAPSPLATAPALQDSPALSGPAALTRAGAPPDAGALAGAGGLRDAVAPPLAPAPPDAGEPSPLGARGADAEADAAQPAPPPAGAGGLSGLQLLLDQLDAMLRDPRLTLALKAFAAKLSEGLRSFAVAAIEAVKRLRLRFPRRALLALLALALPLALLALLDSGDDERAAPTPAQRQAAAPATGGASLPGVAMPGLRAAQERPGAVRVALVLDRTYAPAQLRRELRTLGTWLAENHAAGTRVTLIDAQTARASAPLRASELTAARALRARASTTSAIRSALGRPQDRRLLVTLGSTAPALGRASTLSITPRRGAAASAPSRRGRRSRAAIDDRRPNALAATVARAIMSVSGQREQR